MGPIHYPEVTPCPLVSFGFLWKGAVGVTGHLFGGRKKRKPKEHNPFSGSPYCGWTKSISHHLETIENRCFFCFKQGNHDSNDSRVSQVRNGFPIIARLRGTQCEGRPWCGNNCSSTRIGQPAPGASPKFLGVVNICFSGGKGPPNVRFHVNLEGTRVPGLGSLFEQTV